MTTTDRAQIESERDTLRKHLDDLPATARLTRQSVESRIRSLERELTELADPRSPTTVQLTFRGRPVLGEGGILADFAAGATAAFLEVLSTIGATQLGDIASRGRVPNKDDFRLVIRGTAIGSFGFELEEYQSDGQQTFFDSPTANALEETLFVLNASATGPDDVLADVVSGLPKRAIDAVRKFVEYLDKQEAVCRLVLADSSFGFRDLQEVARTATRLREDVHETDAAFVGRFIGMLPTARTFEFLVFGTGPDEKVLRGKIGAEISNPEIINRHLNQDVTVQLRETRVGRGTCRYHLLKLPSDWSA
jgi:hypothetical protein